MIALAYESGDGVAEDMVKSNQLLEQAASLGHHEAQFQLGSRDSTAKVMASSIDLYG